MLKKTFFIWMLYIVFCSSIQAAYLRKLELRNVFPDAEEIMVKSISIPNGHLISSTHEEGDVLFFGFSNKLNIVVDYQDNDLTLLPFASYMQSFLDEGKDTDFVCIGNEHREATFRFYPHALSGEGCYPIDSVGIKCQVLRSGVSTVYAIRP